MSAFKPTLLLLTTLVALAFATDPIFRLDPNGALENKGTLGGLGEWRNPIESEAALFSLWNGAKALDFTAVPGGLKPGNDKHGGAFVWSAEGLSKTAEGATLVLRFEAKDPPANARLFNSPLFNLLPYPVLYLNLPGGAKNLGIEKVPNLLSGVWWISVSIRFADGKTTLAVVSDKDRALRFQNTAEFGKIDPALFKGPFEFGNYFGIRPFRGLVDSVTLFDTALSENEITSLLPAAQASAPKSGFVPMFRPTPPSEKVFMDPSAWGAIRSDEILGPSICFRLRSPTYRRTYTYPPQMPHQGLKLKARTTGGETEIIFEVRGFVPADGKTPGKYRAVLLKSKPFRVNEKPSALRLMYAEDFEPAGDAALFIGESMQTIAVTSTQSAETDLVLSDLRAMSGAEPSSLEIRRVLHEGHVFVENEKSSPSVEVFSKSPGPVRFQARLERQDGKISKRFEQTTSLKGGEETIRLSLDALPRGYYSLAVDMESSAGTFSSGSEFVVVPKGSPEPWLGFHDHDAGIELPVLLDHKKAGYGWLRFTAAMPFLRYDIEKDFDLIDSLVAPRAAMGFKVLFTFLSFPHKKVDWELIDQKAREFGLKTDLPIARLNADPAYPIDDTDWMKDKLSFLSAKLKGKAEHFEFGNEYDRIIFRGARYDSGKKEFDWWGTPEEYASDLRHFREGIRHGNPNAKALNAGVTCGLWTPGRETFVPRMLDVGGAEGLDIFAVHGYGGYDNVQRVLGDLKSRGVQKPWANTERGVGTQDLTAHRLALEEILKSKKGGAMFYTTFFPDRLDYLADPATGAHGPFRQGLSEFATMLQGGAPGPKFAMEAALLHLLSRAENMVNEEAAGTTRWRWKSDAGFVVLVYAEKSGASETFSSDSKIEAVDLYGNVDTQSAVERSVLLSPKPVYLVSQSPIRAERDGARLAAVGPKAVLMNGKPSLEYAIEENLSGFELKSTGGKSLSASKQKTAKGQVVFPIENPEPAYRLGLDLSSGNKNFGSTVNWMSAGKSSSPTLDWSRASFYPVDQASQVATGRVLWQGLTDYNIYKGTVFGSTNLSARIAFVLSGALLHFKIEITDDELCAGDECELLWLDPKAAGNARFRPDLKTPVIENHVPGLDASVTKHTKGWTLAGSLSSRTVFENDRVPRFEVILRDADSHADAGTKPYLEMRAGAGEGVILWP